MRATTYIKRTGRVQIRFHKPWFRRMLLVIQVEWEVIWDEDYGSHIECERGTVWRDATTQDITHLMKGPIEWA